MIVKAVIIICGIEDYPFIIRFKTKDNGDDCAYAVLLSIEDYPFIIRFKTSRASIVSSWFLSIEDYPFIIRFKTHHIF